MCMLMSSENMVTAKFQSYHRPAWPGFLLASFVNSYRSHATKAHWPGLQARRVLPGVDIINAKGATYFGIGSALLRIIRAILQDEDVILAVSSRIPESMGLGDVSLSLPTIINRGGIARVLSVPLNGSERKALEASAEVVKRNIATLAQTIPI